MKTVRITHPTKKIKAQIELPASKSISNRALIIQALSSEKITLNNLSTADDTKLMQYALNADSSTIDIKNAGTCMRFLTAYFASTNCEVELRCDERMEDRPIKILVDALRELGAEISYLKKDGFPPLKIKGKQLEGGKIKLNASISSQYISALMLAAPIFKNGLEIELTGEVSSKSYIEMTVDLMNYFGFNCSFIENKIIIKNQPIIKSSNYKIEQDWSAASYWYEIVSLSDEAEILLKGLSLKTLQGDSIISEYMKKFGVDTLEKDEGILLKKFNHREIETQNENVFVSSSLSLRTESRNENKSSTNLSNTLDLTPTLAVTAAAKNVLTQLSGLKNLKIKESDRLQSLKVELTKCGFDIEANDDSLHIKHHTINIQSSTINRFQTYNDHRMAMAFAPLALIFDEVLIENPDVVEKSYPHFWSDLALAGFELVFNS